MNNLNGHIYCIVKSCSVSFAIQLFLFCILPQAHAQTLKELIEIATQKHPSIRNQKFNSEASQHAINAAKWQRIPTPSMSVEKVDAAKTGTIYRGDLAVKTLCIQQPLYSGGRITAGIQKSESKLRLALAQTEKRNYKLN